MTTAVPGGALAGEVVDVWTAASGASVRSVRTDRGGAGALAVLEGLGGASRETVLVPAALNGEAQARTPGTVLRFGDPGAEVAYVAAEEVAGRASVPPGTERTASTRGVGDLVRAAAGGSRAVVLGLGGAVAHDAGAGLLAGLAGRPWSPGSGPGEADPGGASAVRWVAQARAGLNGAQLVGLVHDELPLLGLHGAGSRLPGEVGQETERRFSAWAHALAPAVATLSRDLLVRGDVRAAARRLTSAGGTGAGGGLGTAVLVAGGTLVPATRWVADRAGLDGAVDDADVVVVVVDVLDAAALHDGEVPDAARRAGRLGVPVVVVGSRVEAGRREAGAAGVAGTYEVSGDAAHRAARIARVARTWTPSRGA